MCDALGENPKRCFEHNALFEGEFVMIQMTRKQKLCQYLIRVPFLTLAFPIIKICFEPEGSRE